MLSANFETFAHIESVFQDLDFRIKVTRNELERMFAEFEQAYLTPIEMALQRANTTMENLERILLMGAGTRVPRLQHILGHFFERFGIVNFFKMHCNFYSKQLSHNLNTDEAIALGAIYHAARVSKSFRVKRFDVVDQPIVEEEQPSVKPMDEEEIAQAKAL